MRYNITNSLGRRNKEVLAMEAIIWLVIFALLIVVEIITLGLTTIWFAVGAFVAFVAALLGARSGLLR